MGASGGVRGAAVRAVAGREDGNREGRERRAALQLLQLQQTGACLLVQMKRTFLLETQRFISQQVF